VNNWSVSQISQLGILTKILGQPLHVEATNRHKIPHMRICWGWGYIILGPHGNIQPALHFGKMSQEEIIENLKRVKGV